MTTIEERVADRVLADRVATRFVNALSVGDTFENEHWRIHRYVNSIHATQLLNAGKRGKTVQTLVLMANNSSKVPMESIAMEMMLWAKRGADFARMKQVFDENKDIFGHDIDVSISTDKGVNVTPGGFKPIEIKTDHMIVEVGYREFRVRDLVDKNNEPTCIPAAKGGIKGIPMFYRWVKDNEESIKQMKYRDVLQEMRKMGLPYHDYCAMD